MPTNTPVRETKTLAFQVKATGVAVNAQGQEVGQIEAYGAVFGNIDEGNDRIVKGAFTRTINNSKSRAKAREKVYLLKMLWQHKTDEVIGGWSDLSEDTFGLRCKGDVLLSTQRGREYYELARAGMIDEFSIIYDVMQGGAVYDKSGVRDLSELRLYSIDPVTFAMNDETYLVGVKSMDFKSVCGNTSGPIGPRDESWDGGRAKREIWAAAEKEDGSIDTALAKKYFMVCDGDAQQKGSYGYPFWYVGNDPHISVGAVKAIASAVQGARGADAPSGLKAKVAALYNRINKKYPDAEQLTPPWKDDSGKSREDTMNTKNLMAHYNEEMAKDLLEDWQDVYLCALTCAMLGALKSSDTSKVSETLDDFKTLIMEKFMPQAQDVDLSQYLMDTEYTSNGSAEYSMQYGTDSKPDYGYMSNARTHARKAGRAISATNADKIQGAADGLHDMADTHMKAMKTAYKAMQDHVKAVHTAADDLATIIQGSEAAYGDDPGNAGDQQEGKSATSRHTARGTQERPSTDTANEDEITAALRQLKSLKIAN